MDLRYRQYERFLGVFFCPWWGGRKVSDGCSCGCGYEISEPKKLAECRTATMLEF
jgi:hypothetical protein